MFEYTLLEKPLTEEEILAADNEIDVVVAIPYHDVVNSNYEGVLDLMEEAVVEVGVLVDINDRLVGGVNGNVHIHVVATVVIP